MLRDLSFRYKIPLRATLLVLITAAMLTLAIVLREYEQMRSDLFDSAGSLGLLLANTLIAPLQHDDLWRAYELIRIPVQTAGQSSLGAEQVLVLDPELRIFVSTDPRSHPVQSLLSSLGADYAALAVVLNRDGVEPGRAVELAAAHDFYLLTPIRFDDVLLGTLVMVYPYAIYQPRFMSILQRAALTTLLVLSLLLPISWYWGRRMAEPLLQLARCLEQVGGERIPASSECLLYTSKDEIGQAGTQLRLMLVALREKQALEQQVIASERLAAIGRITAGIAHEINNPLGGMLNAISTWKRHGQSEALTTRTLSLLERGLLQIKETVAALLVEARVQSHPLGPADLQDIATLLQPHTYARHLHLEWQVELAGPVALPSTQVRQVLLNLLLNAVQAATEGSAVECQVVATERAVTIRVENPAPPLSEAQRDRLFEPFVSGSPQGHGLGLWVTYQLVQQMGGRIVVMSEEGRIAFVVTLPLAEPQGGAL